MSSQLSPDQLIGLQPALAGVARLIARGVEIGAAQIPLLLQADDLDPTAPYIEEIERAARLLRTAADSPDETTREAVVESLMMRGWLEAPVRAAVNIVAGTQTADRAVAPVVSGPALQVSPERLEWSLLTGQSARAELVVEGGPGVATSDSDQVTVTPAQFGSGVAKLGVTVRQLGNTPLLWANITLTTPQETRVVPVVAQWQDAPAATVTPAQVHPGSSASMQQPTQMGITRETAPAASPRAAVGSASGSQKKSRSLTRPVTIVVLALVIAFVGWRYIQETAVPVAIQPAPEAIRSTVPAATATAEVAAVQPTQMSTDIAAPMLTNTPTASPSTVPTSTATPEPTTIPADTPTAIPPTETPEPVPTLGIGSTIVADKDGMVLVYVPAGEFLMGSEISDMASSSNNKPQHTVVLSAYWIDRTEVTNDQFARFMAATGYRTDAEKTGSGDVYAEGWERVSGADWQHPHGPGSDLAGLDQHPVVQVSWQDAAAYCAWAGRRLPTEAEWEKAARGTDGRERPWGDHYWDLDTIKRMNFLDREGPLGPVIGNLDDGYAYTAPVGSYPAGASPYGVLDMVGNVWEWAADWYDGGYYASSPNQNPTGPDAGERRVLRGGSWSNEPWYTSTFFRLSTTPDHTADNTGFRCARSQ